MKINNPTPSFLSILPYQAHTTVVANFNITKQKCWGPLGWNLLGGPSEWKGLSFNCPMLCKRDTLRLLYRVWWEERSGTSIKLKCYDKVSVEGILKTIMFRLSTMSLGNQNGGQRRNDLHDICKYGLFRLPSIFVSSEWIRSEGPSRTCLWKTGPPK